MNKPGKILTLDHPATYQIKVPGRVDMRGVDWAAGLGITVEVDDEGFPVTLLTGELDQAALHGLLRRLYSLGLPLISVLWLKGNFSTVDDPD